MASGLRHGLADISFVVKNGPAEGVFPGRKNLGTQTMIHRSSSESRRFVVRYAVFLTLAVTFGCHRGGLPGTIPVRGKVIYGGKPLAEGEVLYNPVDASGRRARGVIQSDGTFRLTTIENGDGALPGEYRIAVVAYAPHPGEPGRTEPTDTDARIARSIKRGFLIPERYIDPETSGLSDVVDKQHSGYKELILED